MGRLTLHDPKIRFGLALALLTSGVTSMAQTSGSPSQRDSGSVSGVGQYVLEDLDTISVMVLSHPEMSSDFLIPQGGGISFPMVGFVQVSGNTTLQLQEKLTKLYAKYLRNSEVTVILKAPHVKQVAIGGVINKPGPYVMSPGWKLSSLLGAAGGLPPDVKITDCEVSVVGPNRRISLTGEQLQGVLNGKDPAADIELREGDTVNIDAGVVSVYVLGQVKASGIERLKRNSNLLQAIASAGGVGDLAATGKVRITHLNGREETVDVTPALRGDANAVNPNLQEGDMVVVPETTDQFVVLGYVDSPGVFPYPAGKRVFLVDAIGMARGHDALKRARMSRVGIARREGDKYSHVIVDFGKFLTKGDASGNPEIKPGDLIYVPETNQADIRTLLSGLSAAGLLWRAAR